MGFFLFFQGIHLEHNTSARVIRSNQSLVLQKITKHYAGNYACSAINDEGETVSNQLPLRVKCEYEKSGDMASNRKILGVVGADSGVRRPASGLL